MKRLVLLFSVFACVVRAYADGVETRKSWVEFAERLATPILAPMAEGRLHDELVRAKRWLVPYVAADGSRRNAAERRAFPEGRTLQLQSTASLLGVNA